MCGVSVLYLPTSGYTCRQHRVANNISRKLHILCIIELIGSCAATPDKKAHLCADLKGSERMSHFGRFYLDKEKDIIVDLSRTDEVLSYVLRTPNHRTGNLITNFASLCRLPISYDESGLKIITGTIPCYIDGENRMVYILRFANTKVANIYPDGTIERKAYIPAIAKTLMSQTKEYNLDANASLVKTYIRSEVKFHSDLHTHRSANLTPDILIALGIAHQLRYPYYYVKKLGLRLTDRQRKEIDEQRAAVAEMYRDSELTGKYLERKIDDNTEINFADLILGGPENRAYNIPHIRASLAVMKDGQAVFTNLEKVYIYRYVFAKGTPAKQQINIDPVDIDRIPDEDIVRALHQMQKDRENPVYASNTLYQDKLLWVARSYQHVGVTYAEISDTALVKRTDAAATLREIHEVMPAVTEETGVTLRFLAALRRIPLTIIKDQIIRGNYFQENLEVLKAVAVDPYVAGCDFVGEEINDIRELMPVIRAVVEIAKDIPSFVVRIHAGENDSLPDNVLNSILSVEKALGPGQRFPHMRVGHGLYTAKLNTPKGRLLLEKLKMHRVVLEFQITSNVRLNNLSQMGKHPLKQYLSEDVYCVQGTDGGALYGTDSIDEQLSLERMLNLSFEDMLKMRKVEDRIITGSLREFREKTEEFERIRGEKELTDFINERIADQEGAFCDVTAGDRRHDSAGELMAQIRPLPMDRIPIVIAGGSFNNAAHVTRCRASECALLDDLLRKANPGKVFFVIGPSITGYEKYILQKSKGKFDVYAFVPTTITDDELKRLRDSGAYIRVSVESSPLGVYKSFAYEIFKRRQSVILALDGNSAAANLIQDAKNSRYKSRTFINVKAPALRTKAESLQGYITFWTDGDSASEIVRYANNYYRALKDPNAQILKNYAVK